MNPENANPKNFEVDRIVFTSENGDFSIAVGYWVEDEMERYAMRWNGDLNNPDDIGYPSVRGNPMWFQLPYDFRELLAFLNENSEPLNQ